MAGFDFDLLAERQEREQAEMRRQFPMRIEGRTPNQLLMPDGRLIEGDAALYLPSVVAARPWEVFDDWPGERQ
jgi:hypothetical protein